jgi:hypothetical protein
MELDSLLEALLALFIKDNGKTINKEGQGTMEYPDAHRYKGSWRNDRRHGPGKYLNSEGELTHAYFKNDKIFKLIKPLEPNLIDMLIK